MTKGAWRVCAEGVSTGGCSGLVPKSVKLPLVKYLRVVPFTIGAVGAVTFEVEIVAKLGVEVIEMLQVLSIYIQRRV